MSRPILGKAIRHKWSLDPDFLTINHGSFGATPKMVMAVQDAWRAQMEFQPSRFFSTILPNALRDAAADLASFVRAPADCLAFVDNATTGCNAVLRSLRLHAGDEVLVLSHGYSAVRNTVSYLTERAGAKMVQAIIPFPDTTAQGVLDGIEQAMTPRTTLAVLDHITSDSALVLPIERMVALCRSHGVAVLVDGAHAPGQVPLDLTRLGADWYAGNCHKWLMAPKGCGFLYAAPDQQNGLHPAVISLNYKRGFLAEFDWTGTKDLSACLAVGAAINFHNYLGGTSLQERNTALASQAAALVADAWAHRQPRRHWRAR